MKLLSGQAEALYGRLMDRRELLHRVTLSFGRLREERFPQYDLFASPAARERERRLQRALLDIKGKYGGNSILKCLDLAEGATARDRNHQIGGHRA